MVATVGDGAVTVKVELYIRGLSIALRGAFLVHDVSMACHQHLAGVAGHHQLFRFCTGNPAVNQLGGVLIRQRHGSPCQRVAVGVHLGKLDFQRLVNNSQCLAIQLAGFGSYGNGKIRIDGKGNIAGHGIACRSVSFAQQVVAGRKLHLVRSAFGLPAVDLALGAIGAYAVNHQFCAGQFIAAGGGLFAHDQLLPLGVGKGKGFAVIAGSHGGNIAIQAGHILADVAVGHALADIKVSGAIPRDGTGGAALLAILGIGQHNSGRAVVAVIGNPLFLDRDAAIAADIAGVTVFHMFLDHNVHDPAGTRTKKTVGYRDGNAVHRAGKGCGNGKVAVLSIGIIADAVREVNIQIAVVFAALIEADVAIRILDIIVAGAGIQQPADIHTQVAVALGGVFFHQAGVIQDCLAARCHRCAIQHGCIMGIGHIGRIGLIHQCGIVRVISAALQTEQHVEGDGIANLHGQRGSLLAHLVQLVQGIVHTIDRNGNTLDVIHQVHTSIGRCIIIGIIVIILCRMGTCCKGKHQQNQQQAVPHAVP